MDLVTLVLIGFIGGLVTGVSPCVLPMLPVIFYAGTTASPGAADRAKASNGDTMVATRPGLRGRLAIFVRPLKIIAGLVTSFSLIALFGTTVLSFLGLPDQLLLWIGVGVLSAVGLGLIFPPLGHLIERPFYRLPKINNSTAAPFLFGMGLGTLYIPCAGPVLAAIVVAGATGTVGLETILLTVAFAIGAALPLLFFAAAGSKASERIRAFREKARAFRITSGILLIALAIALVSGAPAALQRALPNYTGDIEQQIADSDTVQGALAPLETDENRGLSQCTPGDPELADCGPAPSLKNTGEWFNTSGDDDLSIDDFQGEVLLIDFWAYSCINCQRDAPHIKDWYDTYGDLGLEVLGIHSPEFAFEKDAGNVKAAIDKEGITWPVVQDNSLSTWTNYRNRYWPAKYLVDATGTVRAVKFGEGDYSGTEDKIRELLQEADPSIELPEAVEDGTADRPETEDKTPETFFGWTKAKNYAGSPSFDTGEEATYTLSDPQGDDTYSLGGRWDIETQQAIARGDSRSRLSFDSRHVFHVLAGEGTIRVSVDGGPPKTITISGEPNLYEVYSSEEPGRHTLDIEYSEGLEVFTFSFG